MSVYVAAVLSLSGLVSRLESDREVACPQFYLSSNYLFVLRNPAMVVNCRLYTLVVYVMLMI